MTDIILNTKHLIGGIDTFERGKFITLHSHHRPQEFGDTIKLNYVLNDLGIYLVPKHRGHHTYSYLKNL